MTLPEVGATSLWQSRSVRLFPAPLGPSRTVRPPRSSVKLNWSMRVRPFTVSDTLSKRSNAGDGANNG
jgi:hypothetical protein